MYLKRFVGLGAALAVALSACDDDPTAPAANFALVGCPTGDLAVNAPINLNFTQNVLPSSVSGANIIVTDASTGIEVPGGLGFGASGSQIQFSSSAPLAFGTVLSIRVQNLLSVDGTTPLRVVVCNVRTQAPPIAEVVWDSLEPPSGTRLLGASLYAPDSGWVASFAVPLFRRIGVATQTGANNNGVLSGGWDIRFNQPYFAASFDVDFISKQHGFAAHFDTRNFRGVITETDDDGAVFDTVFFLPGRSVNRLRIDSTAASGLVALAGGGTVANAAFLRRSGGPATWAVTSSFGATASVSDIDYTRNDVNTAYGVSLGVRVNASTVIIRPGRLFRSGDGGASWAEVAGTAADSQTIAYYGVAKRQNGDVFVSGGNGFFARMANGGTTLTRINLGIPSLDSANFEALRYTDVQFAPDNDQVGWVIGQQLTGFSNGIPRYQGLIFMTRDGGATWIRQGVRNANGYGAEFPALNRLEVFSSTEVWAVGEGGIVLSFNP